MVGKCKNYNQCEAEKNERAKHSEVLTQRLQIQQGALNKLLITLCFWDGAVTSFW